MANALDPEAAKAPNLYLNYSAGDSSAPVPYDINFYFQEDRKKCISDFEASKEHAEKRLGILLLLKYKYTLDRLGEEYYYALFDDSVKCPVTCEAYVQARDLYQSHLDHYPAPYPTRAAYEDFLTREASGFVARRRRCVDSKPIKPGQVKELKGAVDLGLPWDRTWDPDLHPGFEKLVQSGVKKVAEAKGAAHAFYRRSVYALLGGFALVVPMLIMKLYPSTLNVCLTTTLFVIVAALLMALFMKDTEPKDVLGVTAAYAAVLVVFVGTNTTTSGGDNKKVGIITGSIVGALALVIGVSLIRMRLWVQNGDWIPTPQSLFKITRV